MSELGLLVVAGALAVLCAFMAVVGVRRELRIERIARAGQERERELLTIADRRHRAFWTSPHTWIDPDCCECGGEGVPCCDPPTYPYRKSLEGVEFGGDGWLSENHRPARRRVTGEALWAAIDEMQTGSFPVIRPEDPTPPR